MTVRLGRLALLVTFLLLVPVGAAQAECAPLDALIGCEDPAPPAPPPPPPLPEPPPASPEPEPEPGPTGPVDVPEAAGRLLELMNGERTAHGLPLLTARGDVAGIAGAHSQAMAEANDIWHNDAYFTAETKTALGAATTGENVAMNADVDDAHRRLMNSPEHRANILNGAFTVVGVAVTRQGDGTYFVTEDFLEPLPPPPPLPAASPPASVPASLASPPEVAGVPAPLARALPTDDAASLELAAPTAAGFPGRRSPAGGSFPLWPLATLALLAVTIAVGTVAARKWRGRVGREGVGTGAWRSPSRSSTFAS